MTKKLLPAMIGAALVGSMTSAAADVTIFGQIDESIVNKDIDAGWVNIGSMPSSWDPASSDVDDTNLQSTNSSIGVKGSEDLGNGLKAIFMLDFQYDIDNVKSAGLSDRDQWVGLAGNFGTIKLGTASTSYKAHGAKIDPLYRTAAQGRSWGMQSFLHGNAGEEGQGRADNSIFYTSPNWNGLEVMAHYTLDSDETSDCTTAAAAAKTDCESDDPYGIGASYTNGGLLVFADYIANNGDNNDNADGDLEAWKVGGKYTMNNFAVYGQYEDITDDFGNQFGGNTELDYTLWHVAGSYTMGNNMVYLGYGAGEIDDLDNAIPGGSGSDLTTITVAGTHSLSKRTMLYAAYVMHEQDNDSGLNNLLTTEIGASKAVNDPEADVFALGLRHKF